MKGDPLDQFRNSKVPLWARWLGEYRAWSRARKVRKEAQKEVIFVTAIFCWVWLTDYKQNVCGTFALFRKGKRRWYEYTPPTYLSAEWERKHKLYHTIILPWVHGEWNDAQMRRLGQQSESVPERQK